MPNEKSDLELSEVQALPSSPRSILEKITDAFASIDLQFRYVWVNKESERLTGLAREQIIGHSIWELFPEFVGSILDRKFRLAIEQQTTQQFEFFHERVNHWYFYKVYPTAEVHPTVNGALEIYWHDITEKKRLQADLHRQTAMLQQVKNSLIVMDLNGIITHWNRSAAEIFGYSSAEIIGSHVALLYFDEDRATVRDRILAPFLRDGGTQLEMRNRRRSGEECYSRISFSLLREESNQPYAILGVSTDITAQRTAELALRDSEEQYRELANSIPQVAHLTSPDGKTTLINQHWETYAGIAPGQGLELDWLSWVHPDDVPSLVEQWQKCVQTGDPFEKEYRLRNAAGEYRWHLGRSVAIRQANGEIKHWVGTATDIHARKSAELALQESEQLFRLASLALDGIVYDWRPQTGVVRRSGSIAKILGIAPEAVEQTDHWWQNLIHPDDIAKTGLSNLDNLDREQSSFESEFRIRRADGHWVYVCDRGFIVRDEAGIPIRVVGSIQDITQKKRLEAEIRETNVRLAFQAGILTTTDDAVVAVDGNRCISYLSPAAEKLYGIKSADFLGKPLADAHSYEWITPEDKTRAFASLAESRTWKGDAIHIRNDGKRFYVNSTVNLLPPENGGGMVAVIRDISEEKHADVESRKQAADLLRANEDLLHFAYAVSHDLQAPLRTAISFSQMLALRYKGRLDERGDDFIRMIVEAGNRMSVMIRDLLEYAKCAGAELPAYRNISLDHALKVAISNFKNEIRTAAAVITSDPLPEVLGNSGQITQVFQNLIGNALKYRKPGIAPEIHVTVERAASEWMIQVCDNGIGFEARSAEKIFQVFKRLHGAEYAGTGVGLAICKRIVERRGGRIWASGEPGVGAIFTFSIPDDPASYRPLSNNYALLSRQEEPETPTTVPPSSNFAASLDELFQTLDLAPVSVRDLNGTISVWTQGSERLFGWSKSEAVGRFTHELLGTVFPVPFSEIEAALLQDGAWKGQLRMLRRDGSTVWLASHWTLYRNFSGRPQSIIEVSNDITALKEAEEALLRSSGQRDLALRAGRMGVWSYDSRTGLVDWDETVERLHGLTPGTFAGTLEASKHWVHPDDLALFESTVSETLASGIEYALDYRALRVDGSTFWLQEQGQVVRHDGEVAGMVGVVWDISWRKAEDLDRQFLLDLNSRLNECRQAAELLQLAVTTLGTHLGVARCAYGEVDAAADQITVLADYHPDAATLQTTYSFSAFSTLAPELQAGNVVNVTETRTDPRTADHYAERYAPLNAEAFAIVPLHRDGSLVASLTVSSKHPRIWSERETRLLRGVAERLWPVLQNVRLLQLTIDRQEQFEATFDAAAVGLAHIASNGRLLHMNDALCRLTGYSREEMLACCFQDVTHPDDLNLNLQLFKSLQEGKIPSYSIEKRIVHKNGTPGWVNLTVTLMRESVGTSKYAIAIIEDIDARKRAEQELQQSTRTSALQLREIETIYSQVPIGLVLLDTHFRYVRVNDLFAKLNGIAAADHVGRTISEVLPSLASQLTPVLDKLLETRSPVLETEIRDTIPGRPESESTRLCSYYPVEGPDGKVLGIHGVVQDVTERRHSEQNWPGIGGLLQHATSSARLGIFVFDIRNRKTYWENQRMFEIFGRTREQGPVGYQEFVSTILHPDDVSEFTAAFADSSARGTLWKSQCRIYRGDGALRHIEFAGHFDSDPQSVATHFTGVVADVTERVLEEQTSRDNPRAPLKVLASHQIFVGLMSPDGVLLETNQTPLKAAGLELRDVIGKPLPDTFWWSYSLQVKDRLWEAIRKAKAGEPARFFVQARVNEDRFVPVDLTVAALTGEDGQLLNLIVSGVQIDQRMAAPGVPHPTEERYLLAEWATNDGLWDWNPTTDDCYFSPRFKALLGLEDSEMENKGTAVFARLHAEDSPVLFGAVKAHFSHDEPYDVQIRLLTKNQSYRWFRSRGRAVRDDDGNVTRMVGSMSDIHDQKEAEARSREHDEQLRTMFDSIDQLAWMAKGDGSIFWYNQRWYEYTGTTVEQMSGWGWQSVHDPEVLPKVMACWATSILSGEPLAMEFPLRGKDGHFRTFLTRVIPVRDSQGNVFRWFGTNTNIDALRKEKDVLQAREREFRELAESLPELVWVANLEGKLVYLNPQWNTYTGVPLEQSAQYTWDSTIHPDDLGHLDEIWRRCVITGQHYEMESRLRRHDGVYRWFLHRAQPVRGGNGVILNWLGTSTDINEQKTTEQALRRSNEDLEQFAYAASHDLQEPLRIVSIYAQVIRSKFEGHGDDADRFSRYIVNAARQMDSLVKGILAYSRAGDTSEIPVILSANGVFDQSLLEMEPAIAESGATISRDDLPEVFFPEVQLLQLLQNLIGNALKYRGELPPRIHLSTERQGGMQKFSLSDNGIGIRAEYLDRIFGMFKRLHKEGYAGAGVGLAVCKRLVERQGGRIWAESKLGQGTTFSFTLPLPK